MSRLEQLLEDLAPDVLHYLLLMAGPIATYHLALTCKSTFDRIALDDILWRQLYTATYIIENEREEEFLCVLKARELQYTELAKEKDLHDPFTEEDLMRMNACAKQDMSSTDQLIRISRSNHSTLSMESNHFPSSVQAKRCCWWLYAFSERYSAEKNWYRNKSRLRVVKIPNKFGQVASFIESYGPWAVILLSDRRLLLGYIGEMKVHRHLLQARWRNLPLKHTYYGHTFHSDLKVKINNSYVTTVLVYGTKAIFYAWSIEDASLIFYMSVNQQCQVVKLYDDYAILQVKSTQGEIQSQKLVHLSMRQVYDVSEETNTPIWHIQRMTIDGPVIYAVSTNQQGQTIWLLYQLIRSTLVCLTRGLLHIQSNQHIIETQCIDVHRVLISVIESKKMTFIVHNIYHHTDYMLWPFLTLNTSIIMIPSKHLLYACNQQGSVYNLKTSAIQHFFSHKLNQPDNTLGTIICDCHSKLDNHIPIYDLATGKYLYYLRNGLRIGTKCQPIIKATACYILDMNIPSSQLFVWDFTNPR